MKIVVTGSKGFIGQNLISELNKEKHSILEINEDIFVDPNWQSSLYTIIKSFEPEVIFHVGACSDTLENDVTYMMTRNYESTKIISDYCSEFNCKLIYSSSASSYGSNGLHPSNLYGWSKYIADQYVTLNGGIALRYFNVYGYGESHKGKMSSIVYQMMDNKIKNKQIKLFPGYPKRDFVYIDDVIFANLHALKNYDEFKGKYYEVGTGQARTFENILECLNIDEYEYYDENEIPNGYQFFTESKRENWLPRWEPNFYLERGIADYKNKMSFNSKRKVIVFGDSFSQPFSQHFNSSVKWALDYKEFKNGHIPKTYGEIIAENLDMDFKSYAYGGCGNDQILKRFISNVNDISKGDIVIFNWTEITRFTLASDINELVTMTPFSGHESPNDLVTQQTITEIGVNRGDNSCYWEFIIDYIRLVNKILKDNLVYHWTWVKYEQKTPNKVWTSNFANKPTFVVGWKDSNEKTKNLVKEFSHLLVDVLGEYDPEMVKQYIKDGKKVYFINGENNFHKVQHLLEDPMKVNWLNVHDHFKLLEKYLIPMEDFQTIHEETKGLSNDRHYSEIGHQQLAEHLMGIIQNDLSS